MANLHKQIAFDEENTGTINSGAKETKDNLASFQPSEQFGRSMEVLMIIMSVTAAYYPLNTASEFHDLRVEFQLSDSAKFGQVDNVLAALYLSLGTNQGAAQTGDSAVSKKEAQIVFGNGRDPLHTVRIPGALYLHEEFFHLAGHSALGAAECKTACSVVTYYRQL